QPVKQNMDAILAAFWGQDFSSGPQHITAPAASLVPSRSATVTRSGAILPKPVKTPFGLLRVFSVVIPFLYVGTQISKNFAALLEEHDIFVPEDDDDDD
uniref:Essential MCU regulator, mitochondrial n=2 Tax=Neognathae TaxID=8825 RepID=A0A803XX07_MELGA